MTIGTCWGTQARGGARWSNEIKATQTRHSLYYLRKTNTFSQRLLTRVTPRLEAISWLVFDWRQRHAPVQGKGSTWEASRRRKYPHLRLFCCTMTLSMTSALAKTGSSTTQGDEHLRVSIFTQQVKSMSRRADHRSAFRVDNSNSHKRLKLATKFGCLERLK